MDEIIYHQLNIFFTCYIDLSPGIKYNYPFLLKCRKISKKIEIDQLLPNNLIKKLEMFSKYGNTKKKICSGCVKIGYFANHFGFCRECRFEYMPEISATDAQKKLGIKKEYLNVVPYRYSHPPTRKAYLASQLWSIMKFQCSEIQKRNKCHLIIDNGIDEFYKFILEFSIK